MTNSGSDRSLYAGVPMGISWLTYSNPSPPIATTSPAWTDHRIRPTGTLMGRVVGSIGIGADSRKRRPGELWMYASRSSFDVSRSSSFECASVCTFDSRSHRR